MGRKARISGAARISRERRITEILQLRMQGWSLRQIGESMNPAISPQAIFKIIKLAIQRTVNEAVEPLRQIELLRCDELQVGLYEKAINGDLAAVNGVLALMQRRAKLLGLDMQPPRFGANEFDQPRVLVEVIGGEELAQREHLLRQRIAAQGSSDPPSMN